MRLFYLFSITFLSLYLLSSFSIDHFYVPPKADSTLYFSNPIGKGADPWVIKDGRFYYSISSGKGSRGKKVISVSKSAALSKLGEKKVVWTAPENEWNSNCVWAPELHKIGNKWYIYYAAGKSGPPFIYQRSGVLESVSDDPQGKYVDKGILKTGVDNSDYCKNDLGNRFNGYEHP
jgi:GH43 family beta-xylosidase